MKNARRLMLTLIIALTACAALLTQAAGVGAKVDFNSLRPHGESGLSAQANTSQVFTVQGNRVANNELFIANLALGDRVALDGISGQINFITDMPQPTCGQIGTQDTVDASGLSRNTYESNGNALCYNSDRVRVDPLPNPGQGHAGLFMKRNNIRFFIGAAGTEYVAGGSETLSLGINDGNGANNSGSFSVRVTITRATRTLVFVPGNAIANNEKFVANLVAGDLVYINANAGQVTFNTSNQTPGCIYNVDAGGLARNVYEDPQNAVLCYSSDNSCADPLPGNGHAGLYLKRNNNRTFVGLPVARFTAAGNETLFLGVNDCPSTNNTGGFNVDVIISRANPVLSVGDVVVTEGNGGTVAAAFTVTLDPASTEAVTVNYATSNGTAIAGQDYVAASGTLTFYPGQTSKTVNLSVIGDARDEPNETFNVNLSNASNAIIIDAQGVCTIVDDDVAGAFSFTQASYSVIENPTGGTVTIQRTGGSSGTVTVTYTTTDGTAISGTDYTGSRGTVTFADGEIYKNITIPIFNDTLDEQNETFSVTLSNPTGGATLGSPSTIRVTIVDNDPMPTISINNVTVTEGNSSFISALFTVSLSFAHVSAVTVHYETASGTATSGTDFGAAENTLTFSPGTTSQTILVKVIGDNVVEPDETFNVNLSFPFNATLLDGQGVGTIKNDDAASSIKLSSAAFNVNEGGVTVTLFASRTGSASGTATVRYTTSNGTAASGADYTPTSSMLTFANGETSKTFIVPVLDDALDEAIEMFNLALSNPTGGAALGSPSTAILSIIDNDPPPSLSIASTIVFEGNTGTVNAVFNVTLSAVSGQPVMVNFATADRTATAGSDYAATTGTLTLSPGQTNQTINVTVYGDVTDRVSESFFVNLSNPVNATISNSQAVGSIIDDDATSGDFDGERETDLAIWRSTTGALRILQSSYATFTAPPLGSSGYAQVAYPFVIE